MKTPTLRLLITGGTIDDVDYEDEGDSPLDKASFLPSLLRQSRSRLPYESEILIQKDSRFITDEDRNLVLEKCRSCPEDKILISHGSYTMAKTAKALGAAKIKKTIVLFGSIVPINKSESDALFNLGSAFLGVQLLSPGVYIVSNGRVFNWENVRKNEHGKYFEEEYPD